MSKKKLVKGKDYDGWAWRWTTWCDGSPCDISQTAHTFRRNRCDVYAGCSANVKRWRYRHGARVVRVKLLEVTP